MPNIDLPYEELKKYNGCSGKPEDFNEFWEKKINEIKDSKIDYVLTKNDLQFEGVESYNLIFKGIDGNEVYCKFAKPLKDGKYPTLFNFHGYHCDSGEWFDKIALARMGFVVFAMDSRGQGGKSQDSVVTRGTTLTGHIIRGIDEGPSNLAFTKIYLDTVSLVELGKKMDFVDVKNMYSYGASQGGALAIACGALNPEIKQIFAAYPFLCDFERVSTHPDIMGAYGEINQFFKFSDPLHKREREVFKTLSYIDLQNFAEKMENKLTMFTGLMDNICAPSSQFAFFNKFFGQKEVVIYPQHGHEWLPGFMDKIIQEIIESK